MEELDVERNQIGVGDAGSEYLICIYLGNFKKRNQFRELENVLMDFFCI